MGELKAGVNLDEAQVALEGTTVKGVAAAGDHPVGCHRHDQLQGAARTEQLPQPIGVEDVTQYIDESRQEAEAAAISGEVLNEAQENAVSSIEALLGAALPEGYTIEVGLAEA